MKKLVLILLAYYPVSFFSQCKTIEISATGAPKSESISKLYNFSKVDTLFYDSAHMQLSIIKDIDKFTVLSSYTKKVDQYYNPTDAGFTMSNIGKVDGKYVRMEKAKVYNAPTFGEYSKGFTSCSFTKDGDGYLSFSPFGFCFFDKNGVLMENYRSTTHIMINTTKVPGTNKYIVLAVSGFNKEERYVGQRFCIAVFDHDEKKFGEFIEIENMANVIWNINPLSTQIHITNDKEILLTFGTIDDNGYKNFGVGTQFISKISLNKMLKSNEIEYIWRANFNKDYIRNISLTADGKLNGIMIDNSFGKRITSFTGDANLDTFDEFNKSLTFKKTADGDDQVTTSAVGFFPLKNGKFITVGPGALNFGYGSTIVFCLYNSDLSLIRQYRIPNYFENFPRQKAESNVRNLKGYFGKNGEGAICYNGVTGRYWDNLKTSAIAHHERNFLDCVYEIVPGSTENEIFVMTANAILKIDLSKYTKCNLKAKDEEFVSSGDTQEPEATVNTTSANKQKVVSDKKTIKNTGKGILHVGADGSTGYSVNGGGKLEFSCSKKVYYTFYQNGGYNGRGPVISEAKQDCGETINANGDQYNKK